jgi:hypothetical protein
MIFVDLLNANFGAPFCVTLNYHKATLVYILAHLDKVSSSNLFEFLSLAFLLNFNLNKHLVFLQPKLAKILVGLVVTS